MRAATLLALLAACSRSPRDGGGGARTGTAPLPASPSWGDAGVPALGSALGPVTASAPRPGHYAVSVRHSESAFRTTEIYTSKAVRGSVTLTLAPDGQVGACLGREQSEHTSIGHFASHSGKNEVSDSHSSRSFGYAGSWRMQGAWLEIALGGEDDRCPPRPQPAASQGPRLRCAALAPAPGNTLLPMPVLACRMTEPPWGEDLGWAVPVGAQGERWLLLGEGAGLRASWEHEAHARGPTLQLSRPAHAVADDEWKQPF